jgi:hypothetical protein
LVRKFVKSRDSFSFSREQLTIVRKKKNVNTNSVISDVPPGERPPSATNLTIVREAGGFVLRWEGPEGSDAEKSKILYYTIEKKKEKGEWNRISKNIDVEEASFMSKSLFFDYNL